MEKKRYFWLKLKEDFFEQKEIKKLRRQEGGDTSVLIYLKMQLHSLKNEGKVFFEGFEENICEEIALELDEDIEDVKTLFLFLQKYKLVEEISEDEFLIAKVPESLVSEGTSAERVRNFRKKTKSDKVQMCNDPALQCNNSALHETLQCNDPMLHRNVEIDIDIEKEIEIEKDIEKEIERKKRAKDRERV